MMTDRTFLVLASVLLFIIPQEASNQQIYYANNGDKVNLRCGHSTTAIAIVQICVNSTLDTIMCLQQHSGTSSGQVFAEYNDYTLNFTTESETIDIVCSLIVYNPVTFIAEPKVYFNRTRFALRDDILVDSGSQEPPTGMTIDNLNSVPTGSHKLSTTEMTTASLSELPTAATGGGESSRHGVWISIGIGGGVITVIALVAVVIVCVYICGQWFIQHCSGCAKSQPDVERNEAYACSMSLKENTAYERVLGTSARSPKLSKEEPMELKVNKCYEPVPRKSQVELVVYEEVT